MTPSDSVITKLIIVHKATMDCLMEWDILSDAQKKKAVVKMHHDLANVLMLTQGWHDLAVERKAFQEEEAGSKL